MMAKEETPISIQGPIDVVKQRGLFLFLSAILLIPGLYFMGHNMINLPTHSPVQLGIDFTGGSMLEYGFQQPLSQGDLPAVRNIFEEAGYTGSVIQLQEVGEDITLNPNGEKPGTETQETPETSAAPKNQNANPTSSTPTDPLALDEKQEGSEAKTGETTATAGTGKTDQDTIQSILSIRSKTLTDADAEAITQNLESQLGSLVLLQRNTIGPSLASELLKNGLLALGCAFVLIVGYLTFRFQFDYAVCAIIALVHDTLFVFGVFAALAYFFNTEVNSLFVTGILTVVGFSVHDTIVVFDRLRENSRIYYSKKLPFETIANISVNQTLARSINTSVTTLLTLFTLYFFGGETTKNFMLTMILGIAIGTYSSICVASLFLVWWRGQGGSAQPSSPNNAQAASA